MRPLHIFFALLVPILWGGNFIAAKVAMEHFPPIFLTMLRFVCVAAILLPLVKKPSREQMISIGKLSVLNSLHFSLPYIAMYMGLSIASTALTTQLGVPFSCLIGALFLKDRLGPWRVLGMLVAFSGMFVIFGAPEIESHHTAWICALGAAFFWGLSNVVTKHVKTAGMMQLLAWASLFTVPQLFIVVLIMEPDAFQAISNIPVNAAMALFYTAVASTIVAYGLWNWLLRTHPVSQVTPYSLLTPVIGSAFGFLFLGEGISAEILIGGAITIAGVAVIVIRRPKLAMRNEPV